MTCKPRFLPLTNSGVHQLSPLLGLHKSLVQIGSSAVSARGQALGPTQPAPTFFAESAHTFEKAARK